MNDAAAAADESGHQRLSRYLDAVVETERSVRSLAATIADEGDGAETPDAIWRRWHTAGLAAARADPTLPGPYRIGAYHVLGKMQALAEDEWNAIVRERERPSAADYQEQFHRQHGRWPSLAEQEAAGY